MQDRLPPARRRLLQRTAGPYIWVIHVASSALPDVGLDPKSDRKSRHSLRLIKPLHPFRRSNWKQLPGHRKMGRDLAPNVLAGKPLHGLLRGAASIFPINPQAPVGCGDGTR